MLDQPVGALEPDASGVAPVTVQERAGVAALAVLAVLTRPVVADLAVGDGRVALIGTLAAVGHRRIYQQPGRLAGERLGAPPLEQPDTGRCQVGRA